MLGSRPTLHWRVSQTVRSNFRMSGWSGLLAAWNGCAPRAP